MCNKRNEASIRSSKNRLLRSQHKIFPSNFCSDDLFGILGICHMTNASNILERFQMHTKTVIIKHNRKKMERRHILVWKIVNFT